MQFRLEFTLRPAFKTALLVFSNIALICSAFGLAEYIARREIGPPGTRVELQLDRWAAFRNNPLYKGNLVRLNDSGFRTDHNVSPDKQPGVVRIFLLGASVAYGGETLYPEIDDHWRIGNHQTIDYVLEQRLNAAFPATRWEVINAAVKGYFISQDLALYLSAVQRYHPDFLVLLEGVNDVFATLRSPDTLDPYSQAGLSEEFAGLTSPASMSLRLMASNWLLDHSSLYRLIRERVVRRMQLRARQERVRRAGDRRQTGLAGMSPDEQRRYQLALDKIGSFMHPVRQIHRLAEMEGTKTLFVLQPQLAVTRKPLTNIENQLLDYWSKIDGPLYVYGFQSLYPRLSRELADGAGTEGYRFLDLTSVFDRMNVQAFTDYCHLTPAGDQAVADAIFDSLASQQPR
jgi:lysophospholipase L1-like esterase